MSLATKVLGSTGGGVLVVSSAGVYLQWDTITDNHLLPLEKKLLSQDITLETSDSSDYVDVQVSSSDKSKFGTENSWKCQLKIYFSNNDQNNNNETIKSQIKSGLSDVLNASDTEKLSKRRWFVKNCSKSRTKTEDKKIESLIGIFPSNSEGSWSIDLNYLLKRQTLIEELKKFIEDYF